MTRCWACTRDVPDDHSYSLFIRERWGHRETSLGVVICVDCRFKLSAFLATLDPDNAEATNQQQLGEE